MNGAASILTSATLAAALATLTTPAQAQAPATPPAAAPAKPAPAPAKAAPAPAAAKPTPTHEAAKATPPAAAQAPAAAPPPAAEQPPAAAPAPSTEIVTTTVVDLTHAPSTTTASIPCACPPRRKLEPLFAPAAFLVRFGAGPGYTWASGDPNTKLTGASGGFDLTMGGFIMQNFALHADFGWMEVFDPDFTVNGNVLDSTSVLFQASTFRVGASYYFMPVRAYVSLGVGFAVAAITSYSYNSATDNNVTLVGREYTKVGPSFAAEIGKEFTVSPFWGLGVAAHYELLSVPPGDDHAKATIDFAQQLSLRFIATFGDR